MTFGIGATVGEEWLFKTPQQYHQGPAALLRQETCYARSYASVLELSWQDMETYKCIMYETGNKKDVSLLEQLMKRNAVLKKGF